MAEQHGPGDQPQVDSTTEFPETETPGGDDYKTDVAGTGAECVEDEHATIDTAGFVSTTRTRPKRKVRYDALVKGDQIGDFRIQRLLGRGSFGAVYLARELSLDRLVALKVVLPQGQRASAGEGKSLARLKHPNIVGVFGEASDRHSKCSLLWMQFVDGCDLASLIKRLHGECVEHTWSEQDLRDLVSPGPEEVDEHGDSIRSMESICRIGEKLAEALEHAHESGIIHRDIKPANILMDCDGTALLADFNLAEETAECGKSGGGTVAYMSPEQLAQFLREPNAPPLGPRSDVYALGVVLWEFACGERPFAESEGQVKVSGIERLQAYLQIRKHIPDVNDAKIPIGLAMVLRRAMMPDPCQRYPSASAMATAMRGLSELQRARRRSPMIAGSLQFVRRNLFWIMLVGGLVPHLVASVLQSIYNLIWVEPDETAFNKAFIAYNIVVYPVCIAWLASNLYRFRSGYRRVVEREPLPRGELRKLRARMLKLPRQFMIAAAVGWFPGAILFPLLLGWFASEPLSRNDSLHLCVSWLIAGMIATTYSYAIVLYIVVCHGYRACWQTASHYRDRVRYELGSWQNRIRRLAILAGVLPLLAAAILLGVEVLLIAELSFPTDPESFIDRKKQFTWLLVLVIGLILLGAVGLYVVEKLSARMIRAVRALTLADD